MVSTKTKPKGISKNAVHVIVGVQSRGQELKPNGRWISKRAGCNRCKDDGVACSVNLNHTPFPFQCDRCRLLDYTSCCNIQPNYAVRKALEDAFNASKQVEMEKQVEKAKQVEMDKAIQKQIELEKAIHKQMKVDKALDQFISCNQQQGKMRTALGDATNAGK